MISNNTIFVLLAAVVSISMWFDLYRHRNTTLSLRDAAAWSLFWVILALLFYLVLLVFHSSEYANLFLAGYVLEKSLSVDNLFVFSAIFLSFGITSGATQRRILYIGILSALLFRAIFIYFGTALYHAAPVMEIVFGVAVLIAAYSVFAAGTNGKDVNYQNHWSIRCTKRWLPVSTETTDTLTVRSSGASWFGYAFTPAFLCLICIELSDLLFAIDSLPVVVAVTGEPVLIYAAVVFAICGLRSLYFLLEAASEHLLYLDKAIGVLLVLIAFKLMTTGMHHVFGTPHLDISPAINVVLVVGVLGIGALASLILSDRKPITER